jgi:parallel beta-helix repeat protein
VAQGTYTENVVVNKTALTIIGDYDNPTIVDGGLTDNVLCITEPYARVINLRIMNSGATTDHNIGIKVTASSCDLRNNTVLDNGVGIAVKSSSSASISENNVYNNTNGVSVDNFSNFASISENNVYNNTNNGVLVDNASYISINGNLMENNGIGLQLVDTDSANITENQVISNNQGIVLEGLLSCNDSLSGNNVSANNIGVELHLATNNSVVGNNIASNTGFGVQILDADYIKVYGNNFVENGVQAYSNTTTNKFDAGYPAGGNYWSDYNGSDLYSGSFQDEIGSDGIGDVPYSFAVGGLDNYPFVKPSYWQDMGIANLFSGVLDPPFVKTILGQDYSDHIGVRIINYGSNRHVSNVTLYANNTIIGQETITVEGRGFSALTFLWNTSTFSLGVYRVRALVSPFEGDMNMTNNQYILGSWVTLTIPGDVNGDGYVGPESLNTLLVSYGAPFSPDRPYNPNCDIDDSGYIGPENLNTLLVYFGQPET